MRSGFFARGRMRCRITSKEEFRIATCRSGDKGLFIAREFSHRFTKIERVACPGVDGEIEMVGCDGACDGRTAGEDGFDGCGGGTMFENDAQFGESMV